MSKLRDRVAHRVSTFILRTVASEEDQGRLKFTYEVGLEELERRLDANKNRAILGNTDYEETE